MLTHPWLVGTYIFRQCRIGSSDLADHLLEYRLGNSVGRASLFARATPVFCAKLRIAPVHGSRTPIARSCTNGGARGAVEKQCKVYYCKSAATTDLFSTGNGAHDFISLYCGMVVGRPFGGREVWNSSLGGGHKDGQ